MNHVFCTVQEAFYSGPEILRTVDLCLKYSNIGETQFVVYLAKTHLCYGGCMLSDRDHGLILVSRILLVVSMNTQANNPHSIS